ncbi:MAG: CpsD/CapB family tyrosine-protein kinase [Planctomycetes bacterium]|nr:CpsD/CapB family tyrosine-protein kinase [Planctomycetota bacterium]
MNPVAIQHLCEPFASTCAGLWPQLAPRGEQERSARIAFVASEPGAGATTIAACAAVGLARHVGLSVLLVEANLRSPSLGVATGAEPGPGLAQVLAGAASCRGAVRPTDVAGLSVLLAGDVGELGPGVFAANAWSRLWSELGGAFHFVLLDLPPLFDHPEARTLLMQSTGSVLVLAEGRTRKRDARRLAQAADQAGVRVLTTVLNHYRGSQAQWLAAPTD